ncbi:MAG TPA: M28 family peptidase [Rhizomicrobium sp.]|nr:M28 family peptidase [Rhizomicrobium sp.]
MGKFKLAASTLGALGAALLLCGWWQAAAAEGAAERQPPEYLHWPFSAGDAKYGAIDGRHIWQYVVEQAKIAEHYRDNGHPQFWGRISGTSADAEDAQWLLNKYREAGLTDTRLQTINYLAPQWSVRSWNVTVTAGDKTVQLASAQPSYGSPATGGNELNLEVVYVGLGSEADFAGRDVRGKAVLLVKASLSRQAGPPDILKRAEDHGAAAILSTDLRGGNQTEQAYRAPTKVPTFLLGTKDAETIRDMIGNGPANDPPHVKIRLDADWVSGQKSYLVWGTLPGQTDETIYVIAHRDGWFDAAGDNASGVASMIGLAEYFAKLPKSQRRRTMIFIGTDGHHNVKPGEFGNEWLVANRNRFFSKTALMINDEHPSEVLAHGGAAGWTNNMVPLEWYAGGPSRPELEKISTDAFRQFGVPIWTKPSQIPPAGDLGRFYWFLPGVVAQSNDFINMHTTDDTPDNVPWTGLEAVTRAYAKIVDGVNKLSLKDLQRPATSDPNAPDAPEGFASLASCAAWVSDSSRGCVQ